MHAPTQLIVTGNPELDTAFAQVNEAERAHQDAQQRLQDVTEELRGARRLATAAMTDTYVGKRVSVTGRISEETAYDPNEGSVMVEEVYERAKGETGTISHAGVGPGHHNERVLPRFQLLVEEGRRKGRTLGFILSEVSILFLPEAAETTQD